MKIEMMKGSQRSLLLLACQHFDKATKAAEKACEAAFLPTLEADVQAERITEATNLIPPVDDVGRTWEAVAPINFVYRGALVVFARRVDKIRQSEREATVSTADSDALIEELQIMLKDLGDDRNLEAVLNNVRNGEAVEGKKTDPRQIDFTKPGVEGAMVEHAATKGRE